MSLTKPALSKDLDQPAHGSDGRGVVTQLSADSLVSFAGKLGAYIASAVLIGTGYHLWQDVEANVHVVALWSSLVCYLLGFGLAWYASLGGVSPNRRENAAIGGLLFAFIVYAINYTLFRAGTYGTDALLFNAYSADLLTHGHNPYATTMEPAFGLFGVPPNLVTPTTSGGVI